MKSKIFLTTLVLTLSCVATLYAQEHPADHQNPRGEQFIQTAPGVASLGPVISIDGELLNRRMKGGLDTNLVVGVDGFPSFEEVPWKKPGWPCANGWEYSHSKWIIIGDEPCLFDVSVCNYPGGQLTLQAKVCCGRDCYP